MAYGLTKSAHFVTASSQSLSISGIVGTTAGGTVTIEAWVRVNSQPATNTAYQLVHLGAYGTSPYILYALAYVDVGGTKYLRVNRDRVCVVGSPSDYATTLSDNVWYHLALTYDGTTLKGFIDDTEVISAAKSGNGSNCGLNFVAIGANINDSNNFSNADISLVRIWSTALSASTLATNKCAVLGATTNLRAEWTLDNAVTDNSGNGYTLTNNGTTTFTTALPSVCSAAPATGNFFLVMN